MTIKERNLCNGIINAVTAAALTETVGWIIAKDFDRAEYLY